MSVAPLLHQRLEFGVVPVRKHDAGGDEQVACTAARFRQSLALEAKGPAARGVLRYRQLDRAAERRHANLAAEHGFIQRDRQINAQVPAVDLEERMRRYIDRYQEIARPVAGRRLALPLQPDLLTRRHSSADLDIELLAGQHPYAFPHALRPL